MMTMTYRIFQQQQTSAASGRRYSAPQSAQTLDFLPVADLVASFS